jgi:hypothetical protein
MRRDDGLVSQVPALSAADREGEGVGPLGLYLLPMDLWRRREREAR